MNIPGFMVFSPSGNHPQQGNGPMSNFISQTGSSANMNYQQNHFYNKNNSLGGYSNNTDILQKLEKIKIMGKIINVKYIHNTGYEITIYSREYDIPLVVLSVFPTKPLKGDSIAGDISFFNDKYLFIDEPMIEPVADRQSIESLFDIALKGIYFNERMRTKLYDFFLDQTHKEADKVTSITSALYRTRESIDAQVIETINMFAENYIIAQESTITALKNGTPLEEKGIKRLMWWWNKNYLYRRLYMLGVTKREIRESVDRGWSIRDLYYQLLENPYILERINIDTCSKICKRYDRIFPNEVLQCGHLVRDIDEQCSERQWMCMPIYQIIKKYPMFLPSASNDGLLQTLLNIFKCSIKYNCIYLHYQEQIEDILSSFIINNKIPEMTPSKETMEKLNEKQCDALKMALSNSISIITGGPGTGKTTIISNLVDELSRRNISYVISAFTGKAIARLKQVIKRKSNIMTLNMLVNQINDLQIDYLIIDEFSMVCNSLLAKVLRVIYSDMTRTKIKLVIVGDYDQLPPIEPGNLMGELLSVDNGRSAFDREKCPIEREIMLSQTTSNRDVKMGTSIPIVKLDIDCRRSKIGPLHNNIRCIAEKRFNDLTWGDDCMYAEGGIDYTENIVSSYIQACRKLGLELREISQLITVICPYNNICDDLNLRIRKLFTSANFASSSPSWGKSGENNICDGPEQKLTFLQNSPTSVPDSYGNTWYVNDRIMMTDNRYDINVMNGEEGTIIGIGNGFVLCNFPSGEVEIPTFHIKNMEDDFLEESGIKPLSTKLLSLSWAMSVHKSQGSEWKYVIFYLPSRGSSSFINRKLIYTAMSRAKDGLVCISEQPMGIATGLVTEPSARFDNLSKRLKSYPYFQYYIPPQSFALMLQDYEHKWATSCL